MKNATLIFLGGTAGCVALLITGHNDAVGMLALVSFIAFLGAVGMS